MSIQKKSLISTLKTAKKANVASTTDTDVKGTTDPFVDGSLTGADVKNNSLRAADLATGSVTGAKVADGSLGGADIDESSLALVPAALLGGLGRSSSTNHGNDPARSVMASSMSWSSSVIASALEIPTSVRFRPTPIVSMPTLST